MSDQGGRLSSRLRIVLFLWLIGILCPVAWLVSYSPRSEEIFDKLASYLWVHVVMHTLLFAVLAALLARAFRLSFSLKGLLWVLAAVFVAGLLQEVFQTISSGNLDLLDSAFDLCVDLAGGAIGFLFYGLVFTGWRRQNPGHRAHPGSSGSPPGQL